MAEPLLQVENLETHLNTAGGIVRAVDRVSLSIGAGEAVGIVGESGCGKSMTALSLMRLQPSPPARIVGGSIRFEGQDLLGLDRDAMNAIRGRRMAMIFQDPMTFLNPVLSVGIQIGQALERHMGLAGEHRRRRVHELLDLVQIPDPARVAESYPHQLSGGMRQRVLIAAALACEPRLLIADEPTTALDVTVQAQVLDLLRRIIRDTGTSLLLITHDLGVVAEMCDRVYVMYAGQVVEHASVDALFYRPQHPYTEGLLRSILSVDRYRNELYALDGTVPDLASPPDGCRFHDRCEKAFRGCSTTPPRWIHRESNGGVACRLYEERA